MDKLRNFLNKDVKDFKVQTLVIPIVLFLFVVGLISYKYSNNSYALFSNSLEGQRTISLHYSKPNIDESGANKPVLSENMIPVYYDAQNKLWKKADSTNSDENYKWYDYDNKMWANSVTVSSTNRQTYLDANLGTTIPMSDILTMQVWIPRYKYKVWNYNASGSATSTPDMIDITFERGTKSTGDITCTDSVSGTSASVSQTCTYNDATCTDAMCNNKTYTHPAFTLGDTELTGFWVGKFENGTSTNCTNAYGSAVGSGCNLKTIAPIVKPDVKSWRGAMIGTYDYVMRNMNAVSNQYGFASTDDTHMIKNTEWGAVAYLSHSDYGMNGEIYINNSSSYYTGRSGDTAGDGYTPDGSYRYNDAKTKLNIVKTSGTDTALALSDDEETYPWTADDGTYVSSNAGQNNTTSTAKFNIEANGNTIVSFDYAVSSRYYYNRFYFRILNSSGNEVYASTFYSGYVGKTNENSLPYSHFDYLLKAAGTYTLEVNYLKSGTNPAQGLDKAYIKNLKKIEGATYEEREVAGGMMASTTGNVYGVYDMSGGAYEATMGNIVSNDGTTMLSGNSTSDNNHSGFTGKVYAGGSFTNYTGEYEYPANKYLDKYSYGTSASDRIKSKLGDGVKEVYTSTGYLWYDDGSSVAYSSDSWFARGGCYYETSYAGTFYSTYATGVATDNASRLVISSTN